VKTALDDLLAAVDNVVRGEAEVVHAHEHLTCLYDQCWQTINQAERTAEVEAGQEV
jgi:hypothetical protein